MMFGARIQVVYRLVRPDDACPLYIVVVEDDDDNDGTRCGAGVTQEV